MRVCLIIMSRVPFVGAVKKRLGREIGHIAATGLYRQMLLKSLALEGAGLWQTYVAMTPDHQDYPLDLPRLPQGHGDLGQRMERLARFVSSAVIFVGSDVPMIRRDHIRRAVRGLYSHDVVLGPSGDGGYWLVGFRNSSLQIFRDVRWSTSDALADTCANVRSKDVFFLEELRDIDEKKDLDDFNQT